ncbi:MAG TPA: flagellin [Candidatus Baltobacteraceae bacterium]|jgi:flagellin
MDVLGSASFILQNEALAQNRLATDVNALASGLRVRSASDDPSGYAIGASLENKVAGLQQSVTNVQTANNLLNVAEGALSNVTSILQRVRSLIVESNSDINSQNDLQNIQSEINQLLLEINKISSDTNFNGLKLFTGQFTQGPLHAAPLQGIAISETPPAPNPATGAVGTNTLVDGTGTGHPSAFLTPLNLIGAAFVPAYAVFSIISASTNMIDPDTQADIGPGVLIKEDVYSVQGNSFGPTPIFSDTFAYNTNAGTQVVSVPAPSGYGPGFSGNVLFPNIKVGNVTAADVGAQVAFLTEEVQTAAAGGNALTVNDGGDEGQTVSISLPEINTTALNISGIDVTQQQLTTLQEGTLNTQTSGVVSSNNLNASYWELKVDDALEQITTASAQIGAQTVALEQDADNANVTIVNLTASSSNIRDANIGATVTDFTKQQILVGVGNSVLAQTEVSATQLTALLLNSFSGLGAAQGAPAATISGGG